MSYEKLNLQDGNILSANHIAHIEDGISKCPQAWAEGGGEMVEILPEMEAVYDENDGYMLFGFLSAPIVGQTYIVNYNGTDYKCTGIDASMFVPGMVALGDVYTATGGEIGENPSGEPFAIMYAEMDGIAMGAVMPFVDVTSITVSIYQGGNETIHKLENKYLDLEWLPTIRYDKKLFYSATELPSRIEKVYSDINVTTGAKCEIICDGTEYENVVKVIDGVWYIGNLHLSIDLYPDTGEPYLVMIENSSGYYTVSAGTASNESLEVYIAEAVYNEIPKEFLPDSLPIITTYYVHNLDGIPENQLYSDENLTQKVMPSELNDAYQNGILHIINMATGNMFVPIGMVGRHVIVITELNGGDFDAISFRPCSAVLL